MTGMFETSYLRFCRLDISKVERSVCTAGLFTKLRSSLSDDNVDTFCFSNSHLKSTQGNVCDVEKKNSVRMTFANLEEVQL